MSSRPLLLASLLALAAPAAAAPRAAVLDPDAATLSADEASFLADEIRKGVGEAAAGMLDVVPAADTRTMLQAGAAKPCRGACAREAAKRVGVGYVVESSLTGSAVLQLALVDVASGENRGSAEARSGSLEALLDEVPKACRALVAGLRAQPSPVAFVPAAPPPAPAAAVPANALAPKVRRIEPTGLSLPWYLAGVGALAAGLAIDAFAPSSFDHKLGAVDFVPLGLYIAGSIAVVKGVTAD